MKHGLLSVLYTRNLIMNCKFTRSYGSKCMRMCKHIKRRCNFYFTQQLTENQSSLRSNDCPLKNMDLRSPCIAILTVLAFVRPTRTKNTCENFLDSDPPSLTALFYGGNAHGHFGQFITRDGSYELINVIKFNVIGVIEDLGNVTALCTGFHDTTTYTRKNGSDNIAWVTMNTDPSLPTAVMTVDTECWTRKRDLVACNPVFYPMPGIRSTPMYVHSPLSSEFWTNHQDDHMFARNWVKKMNFQSNGEKFPSDWVYNLQISSLEYLEIKGNNWGRPRKLIGPLSSLARLDLTDNNIEELPQDFIVNSPKLRDLLLARNNLHKFPQKLDTLKELMLLDITNPKGRNQLHISDSELSAIEHIRILGLENVNLRTNVTKLLTFPNMTFLNLSGCGIKDIPDVDEKSPGYTTSFIVLDLSNNELSALPSTLFSSLNKLKHLNLKNNFLSNCPENAFHNLKLLETLDLSGNIISQIKADCFHDRHKLHLRYLDLSRNEISQLSEDAFHYLNSLETIKLSSNKLSSIRPKTFYWLNKLRHLDLSVNSLKSEIHLSNINLNVLNLSSNKLTSIENITKFETKINDLDVSRNNIKNWAVHSSITKVNLSLNEITGVSEDMLESFSRISQLDLVNNPFDCCDRNLGIFREWLRETKVELTNRGPKGPLTCLIPGENSKYFIKDFVYEREMCNNRNNSILVQWLGEDKHVITLYIVIGVLSALIFSLVVAVTYMIYLRKKLNSSDKLLKIISCS